MTLGVTCTTRTRKTDWLKIQDVRALCLLGTTGARSEDIFTSQFVNSIMMTGVSRMPLLQLKHYSDVTENKSTTRGRRESVWQKKMESKHKRKLPSYKSKRSEKNRKAQSNNRPFCTQPCSEGGAPTLTHIQQSFLTKNIWMNYPKMRSTLSSHKTFIPKEFYWTPWLLSSIRIKFFTVSRSRVALHWDNKNIRGGSFSKNY